MAQKSPEDGKDEPSLELPSLSLPGLRRRKKAKKQRAPEPVEEPTEEIAPVVEEPTVEIPPAVREPRARRKVKRERGFTLPALPGQVAAVVTGLVVGALLTLLTYLALVGCEAVKGTSTCGGPGFFLLVAILIVMILVGMVLLKAFQVGDPGSTSFLAVGVIAVIALVMLTDVIFSVWMFVVIPVVSAAAYALAVWVTTRFVEDESPGVGPDVR